MKKRLTMFSLMACLLSLVSWNNPKHVFNSNTWRISIGDKDLLIWTKNEMGAEAIVSKKSLKATDLIHVQRYVCGQSADEGSTIITLKNNFGRVVKEYSFKGSSMMYEGDIPVKDIQNSFIVSETVSIYITISNMPKGIHETVLLGKLKLV
ncbi:MAG: hypothetical protein V4580_00305 [Bacteroidota bacterium]